MFGNVDTLKQRQMIAGPFDRVHIYINIRSEEQVKPCYWQVSWSTSQQRFFGYIDVGNGPDLGATDEATGALVFMVVGIFSHFKQPLAYFRTHGISGYILCQL